MLRKILVAAAAAAAIGAASAPAHADNVGLDTWYSFGFNSTGSALFGPGFASGTSPSGVLAPAAPWTITLSGPATLTVTDLEEAGDQFTFYDFGSLLGTTSTPNAYSDNVGECISCALANSNFSHGVFSLGAGAHSLTGVFDGVVGYGDGAFQITSNAPEPASWAMIIAGFAGLGAALRLRRKSAPAAA